MDIKSTVNYILDHPFTKQALLNYHQGNDKDIRHLLSEIHIHSWTILSANACRVYGQNKRRKSNEIMQEIKEMAPPDNLSILLPFVATVKSCVVIPMKHKNLKKSIENQLELDLKTKKPPVMAALMG